MISKLSFFLIAISLGVAPFCPGSPSTFGSEKNEVIEVSYHVHEEDEAHAASEHTYKHSHGPGQPEHEHRQDPPRSLSLNFVPLLASLPVTTLQEPEVNYHRFSLTFFHPIAEGFLQTAFRPPIV